MDVKKYLDEQLPTFDARQKEMLEEFFKKLDDEPTVAIKHSGVNGENLWVVSFVGMPGFWLTGCRTQEQAVSFCNKYQLTISQYGKDYVQ